MTKTYYVNFWKGEDIYHVRGGFKDMSSQLMKKEFRDFVDKMDAFDVVTVIFDVVDGEEKVDFIHDVYAIKDSALSENTEKICDNKEQLIEKLYAQVILNETKLLADIIFDNKLNFKFSATTWEN